MREFREPPAFADRPTLPPPSERRPPISNYPPAELPPPVPTYRREPPEDNPSNAEPRPPPLPVARPVRAQTLTGMPAPPSEPPQRDKLDSLEISSETLLAELAAKGEEARAAKAEQARLTAELEQERARVRFEAAPVEVPTRGHWASLLYKFIGALVAILVPSGAYLAYRVESLVPRVDSAETRAGTATKRAETGRDLQRETLVFLAAWQAYQDCINSQQASATVRGTGHKLTSIPDAETLWGEQNRPPVRPAPLWSTWTWFTIRDCGSEPHVPTLPE